MDNHRPLFERAVQHASRFRDSLVERSPHPSLSATALLARFDGPTPEAGEDPGSVIDALVEAAGPGLTGSAGSRFFGWVIGASDPVGVAADMLTSSWGQNAGNYACSPAAAFAEKVAARWLLDILRLPSDCSVGFVTGATMASFVCLAAARNAVLDRVGWNVEAEGLTGAPRIRVFAGEAAHVTISSALRYLGLGDKAIRIRADGDGRMDAGALGAALAAGDGPAIVIAQAGQMNTGAFDPMRAVAELCRRHGAWLHVDGAFGLWARAVPEMADLAAGLEEADSWSVDGHKWLQIPYDSGFAIVRDSKAHRRAMSVTASYLPMAVEAEYDPGQWAPELSRRARGFAVWAVLKAHGRRGVIEMIRRHCTLARDLARRLASEPGVNVLNTVDLNQLVVNFGAGSPQQQDTTCHAVISRMRTDGVCLAGGTSWNGRWVLRLSVISAALTDSDIGRLGEAVIAAWRHVQARHNFHPEITTAGDVGNPMPQVTT